MLQPKLLDRFHRRRIDRNLNTAVLLVVVDADAIHQNIGGGIPASVGDEVVHGTAGAECKGGRLCDPGSQKGEISGIAADQRQAIDKCPINGLAGNGIFSLQQRRGGVDHGNRLSHNLDIKTGVCLNIPVHIDDNVRALERAEAGGLHTQRVCARGKGPQTVSSRGICRG